MHHTERHDQVENALDKFGLNPGQRNGSRALNFLIGCFVNAHYWKQERELIAEEYFTPTNQAVLALADLRTLLDQLGWRPGQSLTLTAEQTAQVVALIPDPPTTPHQPGTNAEDGPACHGTSPSAPVPRPGDDRHHTEPTMSDSTTTANLRALHAAIKPADKWELDWEEDGDEDGGNGLWEPTGVVVRGDTELFAARDGGIAEFVVAAYNDLPGLLDELDNLRATVAEQQQALDAAHLRIDHIVHNVTADEAALEDAFAPLLGYPPYPPGSPGYSPDRVSYVTGEHTGVTLAMEGAKALATAQATIDRVRTEVESHRDDDGTLLVHIPAGRIVHALTGRRQ